MKQNLIFRPLPLLLFHWKEGEEPRRANRGPASLPLEIMREKERESGRQNENLKPFAGYIFNCRVYCCALSAALSSWSYNKEKGAKREKIITKQKVSERETSLGRLSSLDCWDLSFQRYTTYIFFYIKQGPHRVRAHGQILAVHLMWQQFVSAERTYTGFRL